jgi:hypothetical protein
MKTKEWSLVTILEEKSFTSRKSSVFKSKSMGLGDYLEFLPMRTRKKTDLEVNVANKEVVVLVSIMP